MKTYNFKVDCYYHYKIKANNKKQARQILIDKGGISIDGELCLDENNYKQAKCIK